VHEVGLEAPGQPRVCNDPRLLLGLQASFDQTGALIDIDRSLIAGSIRSNGSRSKNFTAVEAAIALCVIRLNCPLEPGFERSKDHTIAFIKDVTERNVSVSIFVIFHKLLLEIQHSRSNLAVGVRDATRPEFPRPAPATALQMDGTFGHTSITAV